MDLRAYAMTAVTDALVLRLDFIHPYCIALLTVWKIVLPTTVKGNGSVVIPHALARLVELVTLCEEPLLSCLFFEHMQKKSNNKKERNKTTKDLSIAYLHLPPKSLLSFQPANIKTKN